MKIEAGQFVGIVGPSGSGKTSIVSLLERSVTVPTRSRISVFNHYYRRFYQVESGKILYQGVDISSIPLTQYRSSISLVAQEASLFEGTIRDNILLGVDECKTTDEQLQHICREAEIHDFIVSLPEGYNTTVGARGVSLSGGQKQRISIARALIRKPRLLLLDEATSSLDSETEKSVQAVLERTREGRTMVVVAHRLATVQNADVIFVIGDGAVVESGSHCALLRQRGLYYQMVCIHVIFVACCADFCFLVPGAGSESLETGVVDLSESCAVLTLMRPAYRFRKSLVSKTSQKDERCVIGAGYRCKSSYCSN